MTLIRMTRISNVLVAQSALSIERSENILLHKTRNNKTQFTLFQGLDRLEDLSDVCTVMAPWFDELDDCIVMKFRVVVNLASALICCPFHQCFVIIDNFVILNTGTETVVDECRCILHCCIISIFFWIRTEEE